ncbi:MAG: hypothetical protein C4562_03330 [Actinobacteria bacterium]|nr:MAG: hypothetical protein C4562_03330 [Actinomycetota bacterium]
MFKLNKANIIAIVLGILSISLPWLVLSFDFNKNKLVPLIILFFALVMALVAGIMGLAVYLRDKMNILSLVGTILGLFGIFFSLPNFLLIYLYC